MITKFEIFLSETYITGENHIVYHGSHIEHDFSSSGDVYNGTFFSTRKEDSMTYGKYLYKVTLQPDLKLFDTRKIEDCKLLLDKFGELYDDYFNDDEDGYLITTPEQLSDNADNWNPIERTDGVLDWLDGNYDGVIIFEGGTMNILLFSPVNSKILNVKKI